MKQNEEIMIDPYIEGGNVIYPSFQLSLQSDSIIGIYTDVSKIHTLMNWFMKHNEAFTHFRECALYERLTVQEYIRFCIKLFNAPSEKTEDLLGLFALVEQKTKELTSFQMEKSSV